MGRWSGKGKKRTNEFLIGNVIAAIEEEYGAAIPRERWRSISRGDQY